jgi:hypothetical protein
MWECKISLVFFEISPSLTIVRLLVIVIVRVLHFSHQTNKMTRPRPNAAIRTTEQMNPIGLLLNIEGFAVRRIASGSCFFGTTQPQLGHDSA